MTHDGVLEFEGKRVQFQRAVSKRLRVVLVARQIAVDLISADRMTAILEMKPNLVGASGFRRGQYQRRAVRVPLQAGKRGQRCVTGPQVAATGPSTMTANLAVNLPGVQFWMPCNPC